MNARIIRALIKKDLIEVGQNTSVVMAMLIVPLIFVVLIPIGLSLAANASGITPEQFTSSMNNLEPMMKSLPASVSSYMTSGNDFQKVFVLVLGLLFAPMFLIMPMMSSSSIASESFAGEKERKTIEALLYTSASDGELFLGKALAGFIPSLAITFVSFGLYTLVVNAATWPNFGQIWFPLPLWWPLIFWVCPALSALTLALTVLISAKAQTFMGAYQTSASVVVLVLGIMAGQITGVLYLNVLVAILMGLVFWIAAGVLTWFAVRTFNRNRLLG